MKVENFESEYYDEILSAEVKVSDLEKFGVKKKTLSKELYLKNIYGDEIIFIKNEDSLAKGAKKSITKLTEEELGLRSELSEIYSSIDNSNFDEAFDMLGIKFEEE